MRRALAVSALIGALAAPVAARAQCRSVEVSFRPIGGMQIAVYLEDAQGNYVDTAYITRQTGSLGLANRPGNALFKTDFRFPYGRRDMVLPVWAHRRNHQYGYVVMGGKAGNSPATCQASGLAAGTECDDQTIGYHFSVSSPEPFFCSPRGGVTQHVGGVDVVSCASAFYGSKGAYASPPAFSLYPPRADLTAFTDGHDGPDAIAFSSVNDLVAVSGATPSAMQLIDPPIRWRPPSDGSYVLKIELSQESDWNAFHNHPNLDDEHAELNSYGHPFLGQPSIVYSVPFSVSSALDVETTSSYAGYSDWDGATGTLHPPDSTITDRPGSGAGRLLDNSDASGTWRVKVRALPTCDMPDGGMLTDGGIPACAAPGAPAGLRLTPHSTSVELSFASAGAGPAANRFDVRYRENKPITDADFLSAIPSSTSPPPVGAQGSTVSTLISGLRPEINYYVAVRSLAPCDTPSPISTTMTTTGKASFVVLHGCFIATAAYGTPLAGELDVLRRLRDRHLVTNPLGRLAVAAYYAISPPLAAALSTDEHLRAAARRLLAPLVRALKMSQ